METCEALVIHYVVELMKHDVGFTLCYIMQKERSLGHRVRMVRISLIMICIINHSFDIYPSLNAELS